MKKPGPGDRERLNAVAKHLEKVERLRDRIPRREEKIMSASGRSDPYGNHRFTVEIDGFPIMGFSHVFMPGSRAEVLEYREGAEKTSAARKLLGRVHHDSLVLVRGVRTESLELYDWWKQVKDGDVESARRNVAVSLLNEKKEQAARWTFESAWPVRYEVTDLHGDGEETVDEILEIAHEDMERDV